MNGFWLIPVLILSMAACDQEKTSVDDPSPNNVKDAFLLSKKKVSKSLRIPAELRAYEKAEIHAKVEAYVQRVNVDIGDKVGKGQVLAVLDAPEVMAEYAEAQAKFNEAEARYKSSKDRYGRILNASSEEGVISTSEVIQSKNQMLADSAAWASMGSTAEAFRQLQAYLTIRAPFQGVVTSRQIDVGHFVGNNETTPMFTVETIDKFRLQIHVPETYVNDEPINETLIFSAEAVPEQEFEAKLARKSGSIDADTRTEIWEYEYLNVSGKLKPGMYAMANLSLQRATTSFVIPYTAMVTSMEKQFVIRVNDNKAQWVDVRKGIPMNEGIEIFGNLKEGDTLLVRGSEEIKEGTILETNTITQ